MAGDTSLFKATVIEALPNAMFRVRLDEGESAGQEVITHTAGKLRRPRLRIYLGDQVEVAFSPYDNDLANGRIVSRLD